MPHKTKNLDWNKQGRNEDVLRKACPAQMQGITSKPFSEFVSWIYICFGKSFLQVTKKRDIEKKDI